VRHKPGIRRRAACGAEFLILLLVAGAATASTPRLPLHVPVLVQSLVPEGESPVGTEAGVVSAGIPFAPEANLRNVDSLGMDGTSAAQFRVLQRDPNTGTVTWVLATFVAAGGSYSVVRGTGAFGGQPLARVSADSICIATGGAAFRVRRHGFNGIDQAVVDGAEIVAPHADGGVVAESGGVRYESARDAASEVELEDNGPVRAVIRASGVLQAESGATLFRYTVRLQFDRGRSECRVFVTLRNADAAAPKPLSFHAAWFELPLELAHEREVRFGFPGEGYASHLAAGGTAHLFQGDNVFERGQRTGDIAPRLTPSTGLEVVFDGAPFSALGSARDVARGWMRIDDGRYAVLAGMRDLAAQFPSGFDVTGDRIAVELFSRHNPKTDLLFSWGAHETREMLLSFAPTGAGGDAFRARMQWPLLGRVPFETYRDTGAFLGERRLVSVEEEDRFFAGQGQAWKLPRRTAADLKLTRRYHFGTTGGPNQFDQDECLLLDYARSGQAGLFLQARLGVLWKADQAVVHSDDFDYGTHALGSSEIAVADPETFHGRGAGNTFDDEHPHWVCMLHYYHLTGDERVRDAVLDYWEWRRYRSGNALHGARQGGALNHMRLWSRCLRDLALVWEASGDARYLQDVRTMARALTTTLEVGTSRGRNLERGYFYFGEPENAARRIHLFFLTEMNSLAVNQALRVLPAADPLREDLRDYLTGLAWFTLEEAQILPDAKGYPYGYFANAPNPVPGNRGDQTGILLVHGYEQTGEPRFVERARSLAWRVAEDSHPLRASELATHARIWRWLHREQAGVVWVEPGARRNADDTWTLSWTVPGAGKDVIVHYGARRLVPNLGFDPVRRAFRIDPERAMNVWAAHNVAGEPPPGPPGSVQTWRTPVLPHDSWHFAVQVRTGRAAWGDVAPGIGTPVAPAASPADQDGAPPPRRGTPRH